MIIAVYGWTLKLGKILEIFIAFILMKKKYMYNLWIVSVFPSRISIGMMRIEGRTVVRLKEYKWNYFINAYICNCFI